MPILRRLATATLAAALCVGVVACTSGADETSTTGSAASPTSAGAGGTSTSTPASGSTDPSAAPGSTGATDDGSGSGSSSGSGSAGSGSGGSGSDDGSGSGNPAGTGEDIGVDGFPVPKGAEVNVQQTPTGAAGSFRFATADETLAAYAFWMEELPAGGFTIVEFTDRLIGFQGNGVETGSLRFVGRTASISVTTG